MRRRIGTIDHRADGFRARLRGHVIGTFSTDGEAEAAILLAAEGTAKAAPIAGETLRSWGKDWLDKREIKGVHRDVQGDRSVWRVRIAASSLADLALPEIEPTMVADWVDDQLATPSARTGKPPDRKTVKNALNLLRQCLQAAVRKGLIPTNPAREIDVPKVATTKVAWTWLTLDEIARMLGERVSDERRDLFAFAIYSGLRAGEIFGLEWPDVDLQSGRVTVRHSWRGTPTKAGKTRTLHLFGAALAALQRQHARTKQWRHVWPASDGEPHAKGYDADLGRWLRTAGVKRHVRFHDLRHTCASHLVQGTWAPQYIREALRLEDVKTWLGHSTIRVTERYAHLCPDALHARVQPLEREPVELSLDFGEPAGLDSGLERTQQDSEVREDVAQLAEITTGIWRREPDSNRCVTVLQTGSKLQLISGSYVDPSPLGDRIFALLEAYGRKERPSDIEVVRVLVDAAQALPVEKERSADEGEVANG